MFTGNLCKYLLNDKCVSGTHRFLRLTVTYYSIQLTFKLMRKWKKMPPLFNLGIRETSWQGHCKILNLLRFIYIMKHW